MGGALQAIARSSPARGARMEGREGRQGATGRSRGLGLGRKEGGPGGVGLGVVREGTELLHHHIWP